MISALNNFCLGKVRFTDGLSEYHFHLLLQNPLYVTVITLLLSQASFSISQVLLYVFPLLPQTKLMDGEQDLAHAHSAEPLDTTTHLACGGQPLRAQGVVGLSGTRKDGRKFKRVRDEE